MLEDRQIGTPFAFVIYVNDDRRPPDAETAVGFKRRDTARFLIVRCEAVIVTPSLTAW
jgi:hypothetical protein